MDNKKFEQLIELIINENEEQAKELFHDIVVEKSREIYENMMADEAIEEGGPAGQVMDMLDEINAEEMTEGDDDINFDDEAEEAGDELTHDIEADHDDMGDMGDMADAGEHEEIDDKLMSIEDKLDMILDKIQNELEGDEGEGEEEEVVDVASDDEGEEEGEGEESEMMEAVTLKKVSVTHGDDGANKKSIALTAPKVKTAGVNPVNFSGGGSENPDGKQYKDPKGVSPKDLPGAGSFKNVPGKDNFKEKGDTAPKPQHGKGSEGQNNKSVVAK